MKKKFSVILVAILLLTTTLALAACGIGQSEWDEGIEAYKTADVITLKIHDRYVELNFDEPRVVTDLEISFDANKGIVYIHEESTSSHVVDIDPSKRKYEWYYVLDGANVNLYKKSLRWYTNDEWHQVQPITFDTEAEARQYLRYLYLHPQFNDEEEFPSFLEIGYDGRGPLTTGRSKTFKENLFKNKFTLNFSDDEFEYEYVLKFTNGKPSKFTYKHKLLQFGIAGTRKFSMTIKYSATVNLPDDLPSASK